MDALASGSASVSIDMGWLLKDDKMADETTAAIQALIKQVGALTETVEKQNTQIDDQNTRLGKLHEFNGRVLDQKKDLERKATSQPTPEKIAEMANAGLVPGDDGNWYMRGTKPNDVQEVTLTRKEGLQTIKRLAGGWRVEEVNCIQKREAAA